MGWSEYSTDRQDPSTSPNVDWISSLSLGGLSNYWTAAVPRFAPEDLTDGGRLDERYVWPVRYEELVPYYAIAERVLTVTAGDPIVGVPSNATRYTQQLPPDWREIARRAEEHGHGVGALPMAKGRPWMVAMRGTEFGSYHCVVKPMLGSPGFQLRTGARVVGLDWSASAARVRSVRLLDHHSNQLVTLPARAVVVAAGAVDSTVLLLRSISPDFPTGLGNTAGLVGRYLHDHPREWWTATPGRPLPALSHPVYVARRAHDQSDPLMATSITIGLAAKAERLRTYYRGRSRTFGAQVFGTMVPTPDVGISLGGSAEDPASAPVISLHYDSAAVANIVAARSRLRELFADAGWDLAIPGPFHELRPGSSVHYGGSVRMHADPQHGVLDARNRMHDVANVVVCDSSSFTTGPEKNPTLTAMALAARAADRLADDLDGGVL
jgi:choline dehydrogenase-like flavoprotein